MKRLLSEPLLHFLVLGAMLFGSFAWMRGGEAGERREIAVTQGHVENLRAVFVRTWRRAPTAAELQGLIDDYVREEVLYREGVALGLDRDDAMIRGRVGQKLMYIANSAAAIEPTDDELRVWYAAHESEFRSEPRYSFTNIYVGSSRQDSSESEAVDGLLKIAERRGPRADCSDLGDRTLLPYEVMEAEASAVARTFGDSFAAALPSLKTGAWHGPVRSAYGVHLVRVERVMPPGVPGSQTFATSSDANGCASAARLKRRAITDPCGASIP